MPRTPTCVLTATASPSTTEGHAIDRFVEIGSLTKVLTGTVLMRMCAEGTLNVDDPLGRWLPVPDTGITLRQLAEHTSGLPRLPPGLSRRDPYARFTPAALRELLPHLGSIASRPAGQQEEYSNLGYAVLGAALVAAAGKPYEELLSAHVLVPLDIDEVTASPAAESRLDAPGRFGRSRAPWTMNGAILPAGGMWATPRALARLVPALLLERRLGAPALSWQKAGPLLWHNGATRRASVFAGAMPDGRWVVVHRLNGASDDTDEQALRLLTAQKPAGAPGPTREDAGS
ncbi:serine hydrolase domain-containing protein [Streptomyces sp. NPDC014734]|uniref:serine hydrolase domain-containing protein n=1 Tax=Streptomyces sp. NPDC014734 TaxID=3364886 RepID=UPI0036F644FB